MRQFKIIPFVLIISLIVSFTGCDEQVLNKKPEESFTQKDIWNNIDLTKKYVFNNYNAVNDGGWYVTEEGYSTLLPVSFTADSKRINNTRKYNVATFSASSMGILEHVWGDKYKYIKNINVFFSHIDDVKGDKTVRKRLQGEMKFLRAWCYAQLLNLFGGVPIVTKPFKLNGNFDVKRDSYKKGIDWVVNELNEAKDMVPESVPSSEWGRVTKGAVLALKSRVLLYAASKLHDPNTEPSGPLYDYDKPGKWKDAADAAKSVMDMGQYSLVQVNSPTDYQQMFLHNTPEVIFATPQSSSSQDRRGNATVNRVNSPNGYGGWGGNCPTQNIVDAFQMKDGKSIEKSPLYNSDPNSIYKNREMRFDADIVYQGANYRGRETEFYLPGGQDSKDGPESHNYSRTGYTMRKFQDESVDFKKNNPAVPVIHFRLAGIYLNYAEAEYHLGNEATAKKYVNKIRSRVHLPNIHSSGHELLKAIRHEMRIELAFEGWHRFDNLRRWMLDKKLSEDYKGIDWSKVNEEGELSSSGKLTYKFIHVQDRSFGKRKYYLPIPKSEIEKSDLKQNPDY